MHRIKTIGEALHAEAISDTEVFCHFIQSGTVTPVTYGDLRRESTRYALCFHASGVRTGEVVVIILRHSPELFYSFLGAILAGAIPSFMPVRTDKQEEKHYWNSHAQLFERIGTGVLLATRQNLEPIRQNLPGLKLRLLTTEKAREATASAVGGALCPDSNTAFPSFIQDRGIKPLLQQSNERNSPDALQQIKPDDIAFLQHSSGTTGLKKGVALSHRAVLDQIRHYAASLNLTADDRIVSWLPLYHDMGLIACFLLPIVTHTPLVLLDPFDWVANPKILFDAVKRYRGTLCWQPNFAFHHLCRTVRSSAELDLSSMRAWVNCSEPCRAETFERFARTFSTVGVRAEQLQVCYAMAETVFAVTQTAPGKLPRVLTADPALLQSAHRFAPATADGPRQTLLSAGRCLPNLQVRIVDDAGRLQPDDTIGEIVITGTCLFAGYFKLEAETRRKLREGWYHTGDLGFLHEGELFVTGRKNDLIIVHGRNHYAHDLEFLVNQVPGVHPGRCVAAGWYRPEIGSEDVVILAETLPDADRAALAPAIKQSLLNGAGLLPYDVHLVDAGWLRKTTSGKFQRHENLEKYHAARRGETQLCPLP